MSTTSRRNIYIICQPVNRTCAFQRHQSHHHHQPSERDPLLWKSARIIKSVRFPRKRTLFASGRVVGSKFSLKLSSWECLLTFIFYCLQIIWNFGAFSRTRNPHSRDRICWRIILLQVGWMSKIRPWFQCPLQNVGSCENTHQREATYVSIVWKVFFPGWKSEDPHEITFRRKTICLPLWRMQQGILEFIRPFQAYKNPFYGKTLCVQGAWVPETLHRPIIIT